MLGLGAVLVRAEWPVLEEVAFEGARRTPGATGRPLLPSLICAWEGVKSAVIV